MLKKCIGVLILHRKHQDPPPESLYWTFADADQIHQPAIRAINISCSKRLVISTIHSAAFRSVSNRLKHRLNHVQGSRLCLMRGQTRLQATSHFILGKHTQSKAPGKQLTVTSQAHYHCSGRCKLTMLGLVFHFVFIRSPFCPMQTASRSRTRILVIALV